MNLYIYLFINELYESIQLFLNPMNLFILYNILPSYLFFWAFFVFFVFLFNFIHSILWITLYILYCGPH